MNDCEYCHNFKSFQNRNYGKTIYDRIEWWDWIRKTKQRKNVSVQIVSPENKHPRLRAHIMFRNDPEEIFDMRIQFCPKCGRKLGEDNAHIQ